MCVYSICVCAHIFSCMLNVKCFAIRMLHFAKCVPITLSCLSYFQNSLILVSLSITNHMPKVKVGGSRGDIPRSTEQSLCKLIQVT